MDERPNTLNFRAAPLSMMQPLVRFALNIKCLSVLVKAFVPRNGKRNGSMNSVVLKLSGITATMECSCRLCVETSERNLFWHRSQASKWKSGVIDSNDYVNGSDFHGSLLCIGMNKVAMLWHSGHLQSVMQFFGYIIGCQDFNRYVLQSLQLALHARLGLHCLRFRSKVAGWTEDS